MQFKIKSISLIAALFMVLGTVAYFSKEISAQEETYEIGDRGPAGGWIFYDKGSKSDGWRYLEAAPEDQSTEAEWGCYNKSISGAHGIGIGTGKANTKAIIKSCGKAGIAAKVAADYRGGGKSDWFLPSKDELYLMYRYLHKAGVGDFTKDEIGYILYWSSSDSNVIYAWSQNFSKGYQGDNPKYFRNGVRAVRAF